jgi:hypothetical protein
MATASTTETTRTVADPTPDNEPWSDAPWSADILTADLIWPLDQAAVLLYCTCNEQGLARAALTLADSGDLDRAREMADQVYWRHDPEQRLASWSKLKAWFESEGWPL